MYKNTEESVKEVILKNTITLFFKIGCRKVTMDEIAANSCISKRTLYENFKDKTDLLNQCLHFCNDNLRNQFAKAVKESQMNVVELLINKPNIVLNYKMMNSIKFIQEVRESYPTLFFDIWDEIRENHYNNLCQMILNGQKQGLLVMDIDVKGVATIISGFLKMLGKGRLMNYTNLSCEEIYNLTVLVYFRGMCTEKGRKIIDDYVAAHKDDKTQNESVSENKNNK